MNTDQEAEQLARKIQEKYRRGMGGGMKFDQLLPTHRQGWIDTAKVFLEEQDTAKDLLVQAVAAESKHRQEWQERAEKAEKDLEWWRTTASNHLDGIEGMLVEAGTLERHVEEMDFRGLLIAVPMEVLRDAKRIPLYRKVRVIEVA